MRPPSSGAEQKSLPIVWCSGSTPPQVLSAELLRIPFRWEPAERIVDEIVLNRNLRLYNVDRTIALKFPAYLIPHSNKTLWLFHQFRQAYDLYESGHSHLCSDQRGAEIVRLVRKAGRAVVREMPANLMNSPVTQGRLKKFNDFDSMVLHPPLNDPFRFKGGEYGKVIFLLAAGSAKASWAKSSWLKPCDMCAPGSGLS